MPHSASPSPNPSEPSDGVRRHARRQLIRSALAAVPTVLTITAGTARAQGGSTSVGSQQEMGGFDAGAMEAFGAGLIDENGMPTDPYDSGDPLLGP